VERTVDEFARSLIGHPVILLAHGRYGDKGVCELTINPKSNKTGVYLDASIEHPRVHKEDLIEQGDVVFVLAYTPEMVDAVLASI